MNKRKGRKQKPNQSRFGKYSVIIYIVVILIFIMVVDLLAALIFIPVDYNTFRCKHPFCHHDFIPNREADTKWGGREYRVYTNSLGFRDKEVRKVDLVTNKSRILFIGDSFIEGLGVTYENSLTGVLNSRLAENGYNAEILNASAVSYSPLLYYLKVKYFVENIGLKIDRLFVFIDISDIQDEIFYKSFEPETPTAFSSFMNNTKKWLRNNSYIGYSVYIFKNSDKRIDNAFFASEKANVDVWFQNVEGYMDKKNPEKGRFIWTINDEAYNQWGKAGLKLAGESMKKLKQLCNEHNIDLNVVVYPSPHQIYSYDLESKQVIYWQEFSKKYNTGFVNLFPGFMKEEADTVYKKYFIQGETHWNEDGHEFVSDLVYDELIRETSSNKQLKQ
ncbi:MAG: hypothetical protein K8R53_11605 [Bacteroidales bacterium]|nr:hypothetical protein [Bacteroidales bacterium]